MTLHAVYFVRCALLAGERGRVGEHGLVLDVSKAIRFSVSNVAHDLLLQEVPVNWTRSEVSEVEDAP